MASSKLTMSGTDWILLIILSMLWGGSFFFAKIALDAFPPLTLALLRVAIAALILLIVVRAHGTAAMPRRDTWPSYVLVAIINNVLPFTLIFWGQTHITSGLASILNATTPLFGVVVAHLATERRQIERRARDRACDRICRRRDHARPRSARRDWDQSRSRRWPVCWPPCSTPCPESTPAVFAARRRWSCPRRRCARRP